MRLQNTFTPAIHARFRHRCIGVLLDTVCLTACDWLKYMVERAGAVRPTFPQANGDSDQTSSPLRQKWPLQNAQTTLSRYKQSAGTAASTIAVASPSTQTTRQYQVFLEVWDCSHMQGPRPINRQRPFALHIQWCRSSNNHMATEHCWLRNVGDSYPEVTGIYLR